MSAHLRANLWLLVLTVLTSAVFYPAALLGIGQTLFREKANGSLLFDQDGKPVGSRLIAQPFTADEYFQPRPSAASYNGAASGASNWGANNYLLRERVAQQLGPLVKYGRGHAKAGETVGPDISAWLHDHPQAVDDWVKAHPEAPARWLKADKANAELVAAWKKQAGRDGDAEPEDVAPFFAGYAAIPPKQWPPEVHGAVQSVFFESWRQAFPELDLQPVPADLVMASGSGLDPHITLENALFQLDRVAEAWAKKLNADPALVRRTIKELLHEMSEAPLGGLAGVRLVNVLEVNLALPGRIAERLAAKPAGR